ncbi:MAG: hypothetical protein ACYDC6_10280 [Acidobacteriaceae bacterium]
MATMRTVPEFEGFRIVHPLHDKPERKCSTKGLGHIAMTGTVRIALAVLRGHPILMTQMLGHRVMGLAGMVR